MIVGWLLMAILTPALPGQTTPSASNQADDARRMVFLARDLWAAPELQALNYLPPAPSPETSQRQLRQACVFLQAAAELDPQNADAQRDLFGLLTSDAVNDPGRAAETLANYSKLKPQDSAPIASWLRYRFNSFDDRATREYYLQQELGSLGNYPTLASEVFTQLAILTLETGRTEDARSLLMRAMQASQLNDEAQGQLNHLPNPPPPEQVTPEQIAAAEVRFEKQRFRDQVFRWRMRLRNNPYDLETTLTLIDLLEQQAYYDLTAPFYQHALTLLARQPDDTSPQQYQLRFRRLKATYTAERWADALALARDIIKTYPDDIAVNSIMALTMRHLGATGEIDAILNRIDTIISHRVASPASDTTAPDFQTYAWYYAFVQPLPAACLNYAQQAIQAQPQDPRARGLRAYGFLLGLDAAQAQTAIQEVPESCLDPIVLLVRAKLMLNQNDPASAGPLLQAAVQVPATGVHDEAKRLLAQTITDPNAAPVFGPTEEEKKELSQQLTVGFDNFELGMVAAPEKYFNLSLQLSSDVFSYGDPMIAALNLTNVAENSRYALLLGPDQAVDPHVLILAQMVPLPTGVLLNPKNLTVDPQVPFQPVAHRYLIQRRALRPSESNAISDVLNIGPVRQMLDDTPQQGWKITFKVLLDPVVNSQGQLVNRIAELKPLLYTVTRPAFEPSSARMNSYLRRIRTGSADERVSAIGLFSALLREDYLARSGRLSYRPQPVDIQQINNAMLENLTYPDPRVRAWTAYALRNLPLAAQPAMIDRLGTLLTDDSWLVRLTTVLALHDQTNLKEYFDWAATTEQQPVMIRQIQLLRHQPWETMDLPPLDVPAPEDPNARSS